MSGVETSSRSARRDELDVDGVGSTGHTTITHRAKAGTGSLLERVVRARTFGAEVDSSANFLSWRQKNYRMMGIGPAPITAMGFGIHRFSHAL